MGEEEMTFHTRHIHETNTHVHSYIDRNIADCIKEKEHLLDVSRKYRDDGLGLADIGAKLAKVEGKLEAYSYINYVLKESEKKI
jgi:hypothetical protein